MARPWHGEHMTYSSTGMLKHHTAHSTSSGKPETYVAHAGTAHQVQYLQDKYTELCVLCNAGR